MSAIAFIDGVLGNGNGRRCGGEKEPTDELLRGIRVDTSKVPIEWSRMKER
jgi:hypothetical protein